MTAWLDELRHKAEQGRAEIALIGLGYVGLPVAAMFADCGFRVIGIERSHERVDLINRGISPIEGEEPGLADLLKRVIAAGSLHATTDYEQAARADIVLICVETPVDPSDHRPRYDALRSACTHLRAVEGAPSLVIIESTVAPGTCRDVIRPILEVSRDPQSFRIGHCPERVMPGKLLHNLRGMSRVVGAEDEDTAMVMQALYRHIVIGDLDSTDVLTAELVKTTENAYRDVNIAFANQVAIICQGIGGNAWKVRELVNKSPGREMLLPGAGVGGHCIPKDPWLLSAAAQPGTSTVLLESARNINDQMPVRIADLVFRALESAAVTPAEAEVLVLGYAYLEESDDTRASPSAALVALLRRAGCTVRVHDPHVAEFRGDLVAAASGADCLVLMVAHRAYRDANPGLLAEVVRRRLVVDGRHIWSAPAFGRAGFHVTTVGIGEG